MTAIIKPNPQQVARAGEHFVAAELHRRGAYAVTFAGNMPTIDILASDKGQTRVVRIQVKTKSGSSRGWQTQTTRGQATEERPDETSFWILVNLGDVARPPSYFIMPEWWIQNDIFRAHQAYVARHGGERPRTRSSTHHLIDRPRVEQWREHWEVLGLFSLP